MRLRRSLSTNPVKVGFCVPCFLWGGVESWIDTLSAAVDPDLVQWTGMAIAYPFTRAEALLARVAKRMPIYEAGASMTKSAAANAALRGADVALVYGFHALSETLCDFSGKVVFVNHGVGSFTADVMRKNAERIDHVVAVSPASGAIARQIFPTKTSVVLNGIESSRCITKVGAAKTRRELGLPADAVVVAYVGRLSPEKHPAAAAAAVGALGPGFYALYMTSMSSIEQDSAARTQLEGLSGGRIAFAAPESHLGDILAASDCLVNASYEEGYGLAVIEAMFAGVPVIATATGILPDLESRYGALAVCVPFAAPPEVLADAVLVAVSPDWRSKTSKSRGVVERELTAAKMARGWESVLATVGRGAV